MDLPLEIFRIILIEVVRLRGVKRALRLRLVNKLFSDELIEALCVSNVVSKCRVKLENWPYIQPYIEKHLLARRTQSLPILHTIRKTAEILESQGTSQYNYREYALQLLHLASTVGGRNVCLLLWNNPRLLNERRFQYDLLNAAAFTNNIPLVESLVGTKLALHFSIFGQPYEAAVLGERPDVLALLLSTERGMQVLGIEGRIDIISTAAQKGDAKMVLFILQSHFNPLSDPRIRVTKPRHKRVWTKPKAFELLRTPSVEIFQIILEEMQSRKLIVLDVKLLLNYCLRYVIQRGWTDITGYLLGLGTPLNIPILGGGRVSENPLYWACKAGYKETVQVLFDAGAQISGSELGIAASRGHTSIVEMLLENGADVHAMASKDSMYAAARKGFLDIVRVLLDAGMDPNTSPPPTAPLVGAVESEHVDMFRLLVQRGAVVTRVLDEAKRMAELEGLDSMLALLSEYL